MKGGINGMRTVNTRRIQLDYNARELTPAQQADLQLWVTRDGRDWKRDATAQHQGHALVTEVKQEGTYGFSVLSKSGKAPLPGEPPQLWVEADWSAPTVQLVDAKLGRSAAGRELHLAWTASDRNLASQPVTLSYARQPQGPWTTFAPGIGNTGRHVWHLPGNITGPVHIRVEAFDLVGNVGTDQTRGPVNAQ
jgi:hypothetical protein